MSYKYTNYDMESWIEPLQSLLRGRITLEGIIKSTVCYQKKCIVQMERKIAVHK